MTITPTQIDLVQQSAAGAVLLATFADQLGDAFTPELHDAWAAAYGTIAALMIEAQQAAALEMAS